MTFLPAAELSGLRELFFRVRVRRPFHHLSHLHSLFSVTTYGNFDFPGKVTSRESLLPGKFDFPGKLTSREIDFLDFMGIRCLGYLDIMDFLVSKFTDIWISLVS